MLLYTRFNECTPYRGAAVVSEILQRARGARLLVVGDGPAAGREAFFRELQRRGASQRVTWLGALRGPALHAALETDAVGLWLFDENRINLARSPVKLLELLAHGRPTIAEAVGEVAPLAGSGAQLVEAGATAELVRRATWLLRDRAARHEQAQQARASMAAHNWALRAHALEEAYRSRYT